MNKILKNEKIIIFTLCTFIVVFMTLGYSNYGKLLGLGGTVSLKPDGKVEILNILEVESNNVISSTIPTVEDSNINFDINFGNQGDSYITYSIDIVNNSSYDYIFNMMNYEATVVGSAGGTGTMSMTIEGIEPNDTIPAHQTKTIKIKLSLTVSDPNQDYSVSVDTKVEAEATEKGSIIGSVTVTDNDLKGESNLGAINIDLINTYEDDITFEIYSTNTNFLIVNSSGNTLSNQTISKTSENSYTAYLKVSEDAIFTEETAQTTIVIKTNNKGNISLDRITLNVDIKEAVDDTIPEIGEVLIEQGNQGEINVAFTRLDSGGTSIVDYKVLLYNSTNNTLISEHSTMGDNTNYTISNVSEGSYYVVVYGTDEAGNTGKDELSSNSISNNHARRSNTINCKWIANITTNGLNNMTYNGASTATVGSSFSFTLRASNLYSLPDNITIVMNGVTLTQGSDYTYVQNGGQVTINKVTGDITVSGSADFCLIEGTKILLANNTYKNIEDITYNDLLKVWSYDTGTITYEYPIWIKKSGTTKSYEQITFSDGTILNTLGIHGVYNMDQNMFVNVLQNNEFKVGDSIAKVENDKLTEVTVTKIEIKHETKKYYHVVSTRYYNIIANDILTTDGTTILSNLYGFDKNAKWPSLRDEVISDKNNLYTYEELNVLPHYMYQGLRAGEGKFLSNYGLNLEQFKGYLINNQLNPNMLKEPEKNTLGKRTWMVTTSDDIHNINKDQFLKEEKSIYTLKYPKNINGFKYWYNTSDNRKYKPNDKIIVNHGMHFIAVY